MQSQDKKAEPAEETHEAEASETAEAAEAPPESAAGQAETPVETDAEGEAAAAPSAETEPGDLEAELAETKDRLLRALAETENVRRRAQRDVENATKRAFASFAKEMIVVADNLSRALQSVDAKQAEENEALKALLTGVEMTEREVQNAFARNHIHKVDPLGERFDPHVHEAMFEYDDPSKPAGTVGQVMEPGYTLHDQPLRPAKVGVTKGGPKPQLADAHKQDGAGDVPPSPSAQTLNKAEAEASAAKGTAYENDGKTSGSQLDEEL